MSVHAVSNEVMPVQNDSSQADLIAKLEKLAKNSPQTVQQLHVLFDGTEESANSTPDIQLFCGNATGVQLRSALQRMWSAV